jgi:predicted dehydrogenase
VPWLTGLAFKEVAARAMPPDLHAAPVRTISILGSLGDAAHAFVRASRELGQGLQAVTVEGSDGTLSCPAWRNAPDYELTLADANGRRTERLAPAPMFEREIEAFEDEIAGRATTLATAEDGIRAIAVTEAVMASVASGRVTPVAQAPPS